MPEMRGGQVASHRFHTPEIAGSNPAPATIYLTAQDIIEMLTCEDDDRDTHDEDFWIDERAEYLMEQEHYRAWVNK